MKEFFKSKLNIALVVIQGIALLFMCLSALWSWAIILALILEGAFFVVYGIRFFYLNKSLDKENELYELMPIGDDDKKYLASAKKRNKRFNKIKGILYIIFGIVIAFIFLF